VNSCTTGSSSGRAPIYGVELFCILFTTFVQARYILKKIPRGREDDMSEQSSSQVHDQVPTELLRSPSRWNFAVGLGWE
jgi:hypothetical protein